MLLTMNRKKVLFLVAHRPGRSPGQRFRFEQYLDYLAANGYDYHISNLISAADDAAFYASGRYLAKFRILVKSIRQRLRDLRAATTYDAVFLYREAHMLGITWFENRLRNMGVKIILDFDDSIWLSDVSNGNRSLAWLKRPSKTPRVIALSQMVLVGNQYLADYALQYNPNVNVVPTTIDTDYYLPAPRQEQWPVCIGWTGSSTTLKHLSLAVPLLQQLRQKYGDKVCFRVISDEPLEADIAGMEYVPWQRATEVRDLQAIDIGIMPLPNDAWARGKCGFKGLQYMALEIPAVMSPVGVNTEIITDGQNGFLAKDQDEWFEKMCRLIESPALRRELGQKGRQTVLARYSFHSQKQRYLELFNQITGS
jgi:glycosyltransferase involved in cell wall biosynthesis